MNTVFVESWLLALLLRGAVVATLWMAVAVLFQKVSADRMSAWWRGGVLALLVVASVPWSAAQWWIPIWRTPAVVATYAVSEQDVALMEPSAPHSSEPKAIVQPTNSPLSWWVWLWLIGLAVILIRLLASLVRVGAIVRSANPVLDSKVSGLLAAECREAGVKRSVTIKSHAGADTPFAAGLFRPVIVLPHSLTHNDAASLRLILRHELAHVARFDVLWQVVAEVVAALHWPNLLVWFLRRRLRLAHEVAADDRVLAGGVDGPAYASVLFGMARNDCRLSSEPSLVSMARVSTLRKRIARILDVTRRRNVMKPLARLTLVAASCGLALAFGLTGIRAQVDPSSQIPRSDESWSRSYRDTFRLEKPFSDRFSGTSEEAVAALRKELVAAGVPLTESIKIELSPDKQTLYLDFRETDRKAIGKLAGVIERAGWWRDVLEMRKKAVDKVLSQMGDELEAQRKVVANRAAEMARVRQAKKIIDPDPENSNSMLSTEDVGIVKVKMELDKQMARATEVGNQIEWMRDKKAENLKEVLRFLKIEDRGVEKAFDALAQLRTEEAKLDNQGVAKSNPLRRDLESQKGVFEKVLADAFAAIQRNMSASAENELRRLGEFNKRYEEVAAKQIQDKQAAGEYAVAKARYLNEKKIFEAAQLRYSQERVDTKIDWSSPKGQ